MSWSDADFDAAIAAAQGGDNEAVAFLYDQIQPVLLRYLRWQEASVAEDIASEVWLAVAEGLQRFDGDEAAFKGWIFTIARRRLADHRRRVGRRNTRVLPTGALPQLLAEDDPAELVTSRMSAQEAITELTSVLPAEQAEVLMLRVVGGLPVEEVARVVGKRPGTVRVLQHRALRRLASQLRDNFPLQV
ncbi:MAG TPA: sigma-70 family RNA polymerase sigma factor [Acidimicrobiales bacterium]|jgi:RNA polymerase sigma-70 factor (ECF subfamily)|nr:sigma-70 family RNA polymerase sigma factor [Acidimicrobiales bacterium]